MSRAFTIACGDVTSTCAVFSTATGLKPGDYVLVTKLSDRNSDKKGEFELPFTIAETPVN